jgi:drug/metabolite transporter (DMT)-like permease
MAAMPQPRLTAEVFHGTDRNMTESTAHTLSQNYKKGVILVIGSAIVWSFGGVISRSIDTDQTWTIVFWRSLYAALFLSVFLVQRDGFYGALKLLGAIRGPGIIVSLCFAIASISFVVALQFTSVANILLIQAGVPLLAALMARLLFKEPVSNTTWIAIAAVISGIAIMVSEGLSDKSSAIGNAISLLIAFAFATATVTTRRNAHVRMTSAVLLGVVIAGLASLPMVSTLTVSASDMAWLVAFGALNLGLGLVLFTTGARLVPAAVASLLGVMEPVLGPIWVWLFHNEIPSTFTLLGGGIVFLALLTFLLIERRTTA